MDGGGLYPAAEAGRTDGDGSGGVGEAGTEHKEIHSTRTSVMGTFSAS
jgi:hypothetical protein